STGGDSPGYVEHPAGSVVNDHACQPVTTGYLIAEYVDTDWTGLGTEANDFTLVVRPRVEGWCSIDIRAVMHQKGTACTWEAAIPTGGDSQQIDPEGWTV